MLYYVYFIYNPILPCWVTLCGRWNRGSGQVALGVGVISIGCSKIRIVFHTCNIQAYYDTITVCTSSVTILYDFRFVCTQCSLYSTFHHYMAQHHLTADLSVLRMKCRGCPLPSCWAALSPASFSLSLK